MLQVLPWVVHLCDLADDVLRAAGADVSADMYDIAQRITSDVIGQLLLGKNLGGMENRCGNHDGVPSFVCR